MKRKFRERCGSIKKKEIKKLVIMYSWILYIPVVSILTFCIIYLFFNSLLLSSISAILAMGFKSLIQKIAYQRLQKKREYEFMLFILSLSSILSIGRSFESAIIMAIAENKKENHLNLLLEDFETILVLIESNANYAELFDVFSDKYAIESMINFSKIIKVALKQGSSLNKIIESTVFMIEEKTEIEKELEVLIAQKKFELLILLTFVPLIILYLKSVSADFSSTMYDTIIGKIVMAVCLSLYIISGILGKRIVDIRV